VLRRWRCRLWSPDVCRLPALTRVLVMALVMAPLCCLSGCGAPFSNVFMGDSITYFWSVPGTNLGVPGNTTAQMLARYPGEVPGHGYRTFVLLGGTNDVRYQKPLDQAIANIAAMAKAARDAHMNVVLCEIPPIWNNTVTENPTVPQLNALIKLLAETESYPLVDYYDPMKGHLNYFIDGVHPNAAGYAVMDTQLVNVLSTLPNP
jgi:acyl-CoA thioesterase I